MNEFIKKENIQKLLLFIVIALNSLILLGQSKLQELKKIFIRNFSIADLLFNDLFLWVLFTVFFVYFFKNIFSFIKKTKHIIPDLLNLSGQMLKSMSERSYDLSLSELQFKNLKQTERYNKKVKLNFFEYENNILYLIIATSLILLTLILIEPINISYNIILFISAIRIAIWIFIKYILNKYIYSNYNELENIIESFSEIIQEIIILKKGEKQKYETEKELIKENKKLKEQYEKLKVSVEKEKRKSERIKKLFGG